MKTVEEFIENLVDISFIEEYECYGHYPFQLVAIDKDSKMSMNALALGGDVLSCYNRTKELITKDSVVYLSLDFPASEWIDNDFVAIHEIRNNKLNVFTIPYNYETGEVFDRVNEGKHIDIVIKQFRLNIPNVD